MRESQLVERQTMTVTDSKGGDPEITLNAVPDPTLATAVGVYEQDAKPDGSGKQDQATGGAPSGPPIPVGHSRFYCNKCRTPYDLPDGATTWRCLNCHTFNSTTPGECEWCNIL